MKKLRSKKIIFSSLLLSIFVSFLPILAVSCSTIQTTNQDNEPKTKPQMTPTLLNSAGGVLNDGVLFASGYKELLNIFNLNYKSTSLIELNNQYFKSILDKNELYKNIDIKLISGSSAKGEIKLAFSGFYNNIPIENSEVVISNFDVPFNNSTYANFTNVKLNETNWIKNLKPIVNSSDLNTINEITTNSWINDFLIKNEIVVQNINNINKRYSIDELRKKGFKINIESKQSQQTNNKINLKFSIEYYNKIYINNNWLSVGQKNTLSQPSNNKTEVNLPTIDNVKQFLINETNINEKELAKFYPSSFLGYARYYKLLKFEGYINEQLIINNWLSKIKDKYFLQTDQIYFAIDNNNIQADDFRNTISFFVKLIVNEKYENHLSSKRFSIINKTKNINYLEQIKIKKNNIIIIPDYSTNKNKWALRIKKYLFNNYKKDVDNVFDNKQNFTFQETINKIIPRIIYSRPLISLNEESSVNDTWTNWSNINRHITPSIFNVPFDIYFNNQSLKNISANTLNYITHLFNFKNNDIGFEINSIAYLFEQPLEVKIIHLHNSLIQILIPATTAINFSNYSETWLYPSEFSLLLSKTEWNKEIIKSDKKNI